MKKQVKLRVGDIWQVPIWTPSGLSRKKGQTLDVRTIKGLYKKRAGKSTLYFYLKYVDIGGNVHEEGRAEFLDWTKEAKLIGRYNFKTWEAVPAK